MPLEIMASSSDKHSKDSLKGLIVGEKYRVEQRIGAGSFGDIYLGVDLKTRDQVAIKIEPLKTEQPQLKLEWKLYSLLAGGKGIPAIHWFGIVGEHRMLVMDLLGSSLEDLFDKCGGKFSAKTVLMIGIRLVKRLQFIHSKCFLHRDIKPDNFLIGTGRNASTVFAIDFGLSKRYRHPQTQKHSRYCVHKHLTGTPRYASINSHIGIQQSRRDDLESVGFVLLYFLRGSLPWQGIISDKKKHKFQMILEKKN